MTFEERRERLLAQEKKLRQITRELGALDDGLRRARLAAETLPDSKERTSALLDVSRDEQLHLHSKELNAIAKQIVALHLDVLEISRRVEDVERAVGTGPGSN